MRNMDPSRSSLEEVTQDGSHEEGSVAKAIESQTAKLPSDLFLWFAGGAIATSLTLRLLGKKHAANWVGEWAPTILTLGVYNKMVKLLGHDRTDRAESY
jgi:hypothetical protein